MSEQNVEVVRGIYDRWGVGDFALDESVFDPYVVLEMGLDFPDSGTYSGTEELAQYMRHFLEPWAHLVIEAEEIAEAGACVLAGVRQSGAGKGSGIETEMRYFQLWSLRGEKVIRIENFRQRSEALEAAGVRE